MSIFAHIMTNQHHHYTRFKSTKNCFLMLLSLLVCSCWSSESSSTRILKTAGINFEKSSRDMIQECFRLERKYLNNPLIYYHLAKAYFEESNIDSATYYIEKAFEIDQNLDLAHELAADIYLEMNDFEKVSRHATTAVSKGFPPPKLLYIKSRRSLNLDNTETALFYINSALKIEQSILFFIQKSRVLLAKEDTISAKSILHNIIQQDSTSEDALALLFDILKAQHQIDSSLYYANRLFRLDSTNVNNRKRLTGVLQENTSPDKTY